MPVFNPFQSQAQPVSASGKDKEEIRDPLEVRDLLTDGTRKAVITADGELKIQGKTHDKASVELMKERYWGMPSFQALFDKQLALESRSMKAKFPRFELKRADSDLARHGWTIARAGQKFWTGSLRTHSGCKYLIAAVYPSDYPFGEIYAYILEPFLPATDHRFEDGHLCLYGHEGKGEGFESGKTTALTVVAWTSAWLHAYEIWRITGTWPVLEKRKS